MNTRYHPLPKLLPPLAALVLSSCSQLAELPFRPTTEAPNREFAYVSQKGISTNACGPVSLVNALGAGSKQWQETLAPYNTNGNRSAVSKIIRAHGTRKSLVIPSRQRWNTRMGMNLIDLTQTANEIVNRTHSTLPKITSHVEISEHPVVDSNTLTAIRSRLLSSLRAGLPPIINVSRVVYQPTKKDSLLIWDTVGSHSVVVTKLDKITTTDGNSTLPIIYVDPATGKEYTAHIRLPIAQTNDPVYALEVVAPQSSIFNRSLKPGSISYLSLASTIGVFNQ